MSYSSFQSDQIVEVPVNISGALTIKVPSNMCAKQVTSIALEKLSRMLEEEIAIGESAQASASFSGRACSPNLQVEECALMFEVQTDMSMNVTGAEVALKPRVGQFGVDRYRAFITSYVTEHEVYITGRGPQSDGERVLVMVRMDQGCPVVHVMDPIAEDAYGITGLAPVHSVPFPALALALN